MVVAACWRRNCSWPSRWPLNRQNYKEGQTGSLCVFRMQRYLDFALGRLPSLRGKGTGVPASTDDCSDVGGSIVGWGAGSSAAAKSRAAVPGWGPMKPSLTPVVLALSCGGRVECGTESEPLPVPRDVPSATRLRAVRAFALNLSMSNRGGGGYSVDQGSQRNIILRKRWKLNA